MLLVVAALLGLVYVLAKNSPGPTTTSPPADNSIAALGVNGAPSPADAYGNPLINQGNQVRQDTSYTNTQSNWQSTSKQSPAQTFDRLSSSADTDSNYLTNSSTSGGIKSTPDGVATVMPHHVAGFWSDPTKA